MAGWRWKGRAVSRLAAAVKGAPRRRLALIAAALTGFVAVTAVTWVAAVASVTSSATPSSVPSAGAHPAPQPTGGMADAVPSGRSGAARYGAPEGDAGAAAGSAPLVADQRKAYAPEAPVDPALAERDRQVARTARLALTVADLPSVAARVRAVAAGVGGFVASEQTVDRQSTFTLRVPAARLDEVTGQLAGAGKITERSEQADDVTDQVADLDGRLTTQRASVARVRALLDKATTVGDVVMIESELTQREAALESLQKRLAAVTGRVVMSTLTVQLAPEPAPAERAGTGFLGGLAAGWTAFLAATNGLVTALGVALPFLVLLGVLASAWVGVRRLLRGRRGAAAAPDGA